MKHKKSTEAQRKNLIEINQLTINIRYKLRWERISRKSDTRGKRLVQLLRKRYGCCVWRASLSLFIIIVSFQDFYPCIGIWDKSPIQVFNSIRRTRWETDFFSYNYSIQYLDNLFILIKIALHIWKSVTEVPQLR